MLSNLVGRQLVFEFLHLALCIMNYALGCIHCLDSFLYKQELAEFNIPLDTSGHFRR